MFNAQAVCPACKHQEGMTQVDEFQAFTVLRCPECTLEFCDPLQYDREDYDRAYRADAEEFYVPSLGWLEQADEGMPEARWMLSGAQFSALRWLQSNLPGASVLDIGCGAGWFIARARQLGFSVCGVEIGSAPVALLLARGFEVHCGSQESVPPGYEPEVVTLFEVLEHLPKPAEFVSRIRRRFPAAALILSVPSPRRWTKAGSHRDFSDYPPNHLTRWNRDSLRHVLTSAGYSRALISSPAPSALEVASVSLRGLAQSWFAEMPATLSQALPGTPLRRLHREVTVRKLKYAPAALFSLALRLAGWTGLSLLAIAHP
jgi:SAM-dependent methyltransferase